MPHSSLRFLFYGRGHFMKSVIFIAHATPYLKGEIASLPASQADLFIKSKVAVVYRPTARRSLSERLIRKA